MKGLSLLCICIYIFFNCRIFSYTLSIGSSDVEENKCIGVTYVCRLLVEGISNVNECEYIFSEIAMN